MTGAPTNSRMGRSLPDVPPVDLPLVKAMLAATDQFGAGAMDVESFQSRILAILRADPPATALAPWIARAMAEQQDQVLARRAFAKRDPSCSAADRDPSSSAADRDPSSSAADRDPSSSAADRDDTIQVIYVAPHEVHPCHCHHNVTSTQVLLTGTLRAREFDRIASLTGDPAPSPAGTLHLRLLFDGTLVPGDVLQARDGRRNVHWFAAAETPATLLNFNIRGYERATFWPLETRPLGRRLLDPTGPAAGGLLPARIIPVDEAYARFGQAPLDAFPMPIPAAEPHPRSLNHSP